MFGDTGNPEDFRTGFIIAGSAMALATILIAINYNNFLINDIVYDSETIKPSGFGVTQLVLLLVFPIVFWCAYEIFPMFGGYEMSAGNQMLSVLASLIAGAVIVPLSLIPGFRPAYKIVSGIVLTSLLLLLLAFNGSAGLVGIIGLAVAEMLLVPIIASQVIQTAPTRFTGTVFGLFLITTLLTNKLASNLSSAHESNYIQILVFIGVLLIGFAAAFILLDYFKKKEESSLLQ